MNTNHHSARRPIQAAMFAALTMVATLVLHIPAPAGYLHAGDGVALLAGLMLGPGYGFAAAAVGFVLTDLMMGFALYAPATLLIKGGMAALAALLLKRTVKAGQQPALCRLALCALLPEGQMVAGYYLYESVVLKLGGGAIASVPGNSMQGLLGAVIAVVLYRLLWQVPAVRQRIWKG